jgi:membrane protein involved in colicin uptake
VKRIVLTFVTSGLWLVGCDKPGPADTRKGDAMPAARTARRSHAADDLFGQLDGMGNVSGRQHGGSA